MPEPWLRLTPQPDRRKRPRLVDVPPAGPPADRDQPMRWHLDPTSAAADALRALKRRIKGATQ